MHAKLSAVVYLYMNASTSVMMTFTQDKGSICLEEFGVAPMVNRKHSRQTAAYHMISYGSSVLAGGRQAGTRQSRETREREERTPNQTAVDNKKIT